MPAPTQKKSVIRRKAEKEGAAAKKLGRKRKKSCGGQREGDGERQACLGVEQKRGRGPHMTSVEEMGNGGALGQFCIGKWLLVAEYIGKTLR